MCLSMRNSSKSALPAANAAENNSASAHLSNWTVGAPNKLQAAFQRCACYQCAIAAPEAADLAMPSPASTLYTSRQPHP